MATDPKIFKAYDIRDTYPEPLDEGVAYLLGRAFVTYTGAKRIVVGHDMRTSSEPLKKALFMGITDQGADVIDIGLSSTPLFYFAVRKHHAGIMITASHNPKEYNGFKLCREHAIPIGFGSGMESVRRLVMAQKFPEPKRKGKVRMRSYMKEYLRFCKRFLKTRKTFNVVVDAGNGMGGLTYLEMQKRLPKNIRLFPLYWDLDGNFPHHEANPVKHETLKDLQADVLEQNADLGIALDGDGDRMILVDETGKIIAEEFTASLIAEEIMRGWRTKGKYFVSPLNVGSIFAEVVKKNGGKHAECAVGHAFVKKKMRELDALFGAEISGHMYHREIDYVENEFIPFFRILNIMTRTKKPLSELVAKYDKYPKIPETNFKLKKSQTSEKILKTVEAKYAKSAKKIKRFDGLKMEFDNWWFSLRSSNTEPLLRLVAEANDEKTLKDEVEKLKKLLK